MNRWQKIVMLFSIIIFLTGCWDYAPIERSYLVEGIAIDQSKKDPNKLEVSIIDVDFKRRKISLSAEGRTILEALNRIQDDTSKIVVLSHIKVILISEEIAKQSVMPYFDLFVRNMQVSNEASFIITKGRASTFFDPKNVSYTISGRTYSQMIQSSETKFNNRLYKIHNVTVETMNQNNNFTLPVLKLDKRKKVARFIGIALVKNGRLVGTLNMRETKMFFILRRAIQRLAYTVKGANKQVISYRLYKKQAAVNCKYQNGKWRITFNASFNQEVVESNQWKTRPLSKAETVKFEQSLSRNMEVECRKVLTKLQKDYAFDPLWLSESARIQQPTKFHAADWNEQFANAKLKVHIRVQLHRYGQLF